MRATSASVAVAALAARVAAFPQTGYGNSPAPYSANPSWTLKDFKTLIVFGDSYSDDSRLGYFISHNGAAPPVGWVDPVSYDAADGGRIWGEYVKQYTGASLFNYAVSGAVCSNTITPRILPSIHGYFPAIAQYEVPAFFADAAYVEKNGNKFINDPVDETVYAMWIGTNDLGNNALLTDSQVEGTNISTYYDCVYNQIDRLYQHGARHFVLFNVAPLNLAPLYAAPPYGVGDNLYWNVKPKNHTAINGRMDEQVAASNALFTYRTPFSLLVAKRYPGAEIALFDVNALMSDIYYNPSEYLNGSKPLDVTGYDNHCNVTGGNCVRTDHPDSFMWFDPLHPSEQTERVVAKNFVDVVKGTSKFATYWKS